MGAFHDEIPDDPKMVEWLLNQKLFHVATAPLNGGHVNVSPKGYQTFKLVNKKACWYLDLSGSGASNETISHLYEPGNGRITILFQAFEGPGQIVRLYGKGRVFERGSPEYEKLLQPTASPDDQYDWPTPESRPGARAIIWIDITKVGTSCGWSVPLMEYIADRDALDKWSAKLEAGDAAAEDPHALHFERGFTSWLRTVNTWSIDGLPGMRHAAAKPEPEKIREVMVQWGLDPPKERERGGRGGGMHGVAMLAVGLVLGVASSYLVQTGVVAARFTAQSLLP
ncbi:hypothetical protein BDW22DRAFT_1335620 [Trametopsis cervina]|nr:hypothetical protein BDW22DRAFT_1335620 [Trametopsis cervina]